MQSMKMFGSVEFTVESLSAHRVVEKLAREGVAVLSAQCPAKNVVVIRVAERDRKKTFAILRGSCYNIKNVRRRGTSRLAEICVRSAGLLAGAVIFASAVLFAESRVLKVEIVGNGAYYEREILEILSEGGVGYFSAAPKETGLLTARILSLPRVEFCSFQMRGGVLTVEVQCAEETKAHISEPLLAPASGIVEDLVVVRGTPLVEEGQEVAAGQQVVGNFLVFGEKQTAVVVIAKITVRYAVSQEYELEESAALAQALLDFGELKEIHTTKTERGWRVEAVACATAACGLD